MPLTRLAAPAQQAAGAVRERLGAELFHRVAGPDGPDKRDRIHGAPGPRWFPEDAEIRRVHGDASMFVGGIRALLLQALHPAAMTAVSEHSGYRGDMWGRLHRTSAFLAVTTFGTADDAETAVRVVRSIHDRVTGTMPDGSPYAASDPHLLSWVHAAEVDSFLAAHQRYGARPLTAPEQDAYLAQAGDVAVRLGADRVPRSARELRDLLDDYRPELRGTDHAREAVARLLWFPPLPLVARPAYAVLAAAAVDLLPGWTRLPLRLPPRVPVAEAVVARALGKVAVGTVRWAMTPPPSAPAAG